MVVGAPYFPRMNSLKVLQAIRNTFIRSLDGPDECAQALMTVEKDVVLGRAVLLVPFRDTVSIRSSNALARSALSGSWLLVIAFRVAL